ncbi:helix-turn-helix transcriptional regulator [Mycetocola sp. 2940]|uniref:helix-turn-helix transcriptional regulator n=1 Tax=Mycetocola sp. 2940 TaxID=3156452 RepID=UPI0033946576
MWEERADHARRDIAALAASGVGLGDLHTEAIRRIDKDVRAELTCWATLDPETLVISAMASGDARIPADYEPLLADAEYSPEEPHTFATMARRKEAVTRLSDLPQREQIRSARLQNVWRPLGVNQELRVLFVSDGACWGAAGLVRSGADFTDRESEYLASVAPAIASATRVAVRSEISSSTPGGRAAIVVLDKRGEVRSATAEALQWRERLDDVEGGRFRVFMRVMTRGALGTASGSFRARVRDGRGQWALMRASTLVGPDDDDQVAVSIEPALGEQLLGLLLAAYGLSPREREVCREVIAGYPTSLIAAHLFVSANTVQDHLKSVFAKVGVRSRGELVARLEPQPITA